MRHHTTSRNSKVEQTIPDTGASQRDNDGDQNADREPSMETQCPCGRILAHSFEEFGCLECGRACCPACGFFLESVVYCASCAAALLEVPLPGREAA